MRLLWSDTERCHACPEGGDGLTHVFLVSGEQVNGRHEQSLCLACFYIAEVTQ